MLLRVSAAGFTLTPATSATGTGTVTDAVPLFPSLVAVIVALPAATAVTTPLFETVATFGALDDHVTVRPVSTVPLDALTVAVSVALAPTASVVVGGLTVTDATAGADVLAVTTT